MSDESRDLEVTKLCAEAIGNVYTVDPDSGYDPLHDDAQAMALVKKLRLRILPLVGFKVGDSGSSGVEAWKVFGAEDHFEEAFSVNLNYAICECVAKIQRARSNT